MSHKLRADEVIHMKIKMKVQEWETEHTNMTCRKTCRHSKYNDPVKSQNFVAY